MDHGAWSRAGARGLAASGWDTVRLRGVPEHSPESDPFAAIEESHARDYMLRNVQQHLVSLSAQADLKASIVMTVSALLIGGAATAVDKRHAALWIVVPFVVVLAVALVWAVLAIVPRKGPPRTSVDPLFFGDIASMPLTEYREHMLLILSDDAVLYRAIVDNLHDHSKFLLTQKYRPLGASYTWFLAAFVVAPLGLLARELFG